MNKFYLPKKRCKGTIFFLLYESFSVKISWNRLWSIFAMYRLQFIQNLEKQINKIAHKN